MIARVIKVKNSCGQYGPTAPFTWALLDTMVKAKFTHQDWKGDLSGNLFGIRLAPDKLFQEFVDRLVKTACRIFRDPQARFLLLHNYLMRMLIQLTVAIQPYKAKPDLSGYICLWRNWTLIQSVWLSLLLAGATVQAMLPALKLSINHLMKDCPKIRSIDIQSNFSPGICPHCRRDNLWARTLAVCSDYIWGNAKLRAASWRQVWHFFGFANPAQWSFGISPLLASWELFFF